MKFLKLLFLLALTNLTAVAQNTLQNKTEATSPAADDWLYLGGATNSVRKLSPLYYITSPASNGMVARTAAGVGTARTITGTPNEITITNGTGASGNPTASLPTALTFTGKTVTGGTYASPALTVAPTAPTAPPGTNTTQIATTAFVAAASLTIGSNTIDPFTGDGSTTVFPPLTAAPAGGVAIVSVNGLQQKPTTDYSISGQTLTFVVAPANLDRILVSYSAPASGGGGDMVLASTQTVTGAKTFGSAGDVGKLKVAGNTSGSTTVAAATVAGSTTTTLPNADSTLPIFGQQITFTGPTAARSIALPDASFTVARNDAGQTFTGNQTFGVILPTTIELGHASDTTLSRSAAGVIQVEGATIPTVSSTDTLTNKRLSARITTITSSATPTVNTDNCDCVTVTALAAAVTSMTTNLTGTPVNFDQLEYRIKDDGTARAITWGASFVAGPAALPTTTTVSKALHVWFEWDSVQSKWVCLSTSSDA